MFEARNLGILYVVGRLRPGVTVKQAAADMDIIVDRLTRTGEPGSGRWSVVTPLPVYIFGQAGTALPPLLAAGVLVLILTCANAISLLLARLTRDRRRLFIRIALGADRAHLLRQALAEGAALGFVALCGGLAVAATVVRAATVLAPEEVPRVTEASIASPVVGAYAIASCAGVALVCGVIPVLVVLRTAAVEWLAAKTGDTRTMTLPFRYGLVAAQTALRYCCSSPPC